MSTRRFELRRAELNEPTAELLAEGCLWSDGTLSLHWLRPGFGGVVDRYGSLDQMTKTLTATAVVWTDGKPRYCGDRAQHRSHRWPDPDAGPDWCDGVRENCPHCPDGHRDPVSRPWGAFVASDRDSDGQPTHLYVCPSNGAHVAESDAAWLRDLMRRAR